MFARIDCTGGTGLRIRLRSGLAIVAIEVERDFDPATRRSG